MWIDRCARAGYIAKGIVYIIIGVLAVQAAFTTGGKTTDSNGALHSIAAQPFGRFLLGLVAVGLLSYALWRFIQGLFDPEHRQNNIKRIVARIGYIISGLIYGGLGVQAFFLILQIPSSGSSNNSKSDWTARILAQPFGQWLVATGGAIIIGLGVYRLYQAYKEKFRNKLDLSTVTQDQETWIIWISRLGIAARGIVFIIIGFFLIQAARQYAPSKAIGLDGALQAVARQPFGQFLLGLVALGLVAYGIYQEVQARYRRVPSSLNSQPNLNTREKIKF